MGGGKTQSTAPTRYAGIQVQSSVAGGPIPLGWGTFRVSANLLWYGDFKSSAVKQGGKGGGGSVSSYNYSASILMGICAGQISSIRTVYKDQTALTSGSTTALQQAGLTAGLFNGAIGQAPWSYLTSNHPSQAIGYSGIAYTAAANYALGSDATAPNHSFEVVSDVTVTGHDDANPKDIVSQFLPLVPYWQTSWLGDLSDYGNYCLAAGLLLSPVLDQQRTAADFLTEVLQASNSDAVWSNGVLNIVPYGDTQITNNNVTWTPNLTPIYSLGDGDFIPPSAGDDPVTVDISRDDDAYNYVQVEFLDRTNQYNTQVVPAVDQASIDQWGKRVNSSPYSLHAICDPSVAATVAQLIVQQTSNNRRTFKFSLPWNFVLLDPMDIVELTTGDLNQVAVRITEIDEADDGELAFTAEEVLIGAGHTPLITRPGSSAYQANFQVQPGNTSSPVMVHPPRQLTNGDLQVWVGASGGANWGGCEVWGSYDNASFQRLGVIQAAARYGVTTSTLASGSDPDTTNSVGVDLTASNGALNSGTQTDADNHTTMCLVGSEVIAYETATLTAANKYTLGAYLRRGLYGTTIGAQASGSVFLRLDDAVFAFTYQPDQVGKTIYLKFRSFNIFQEQFQDLSTLSAYSVVLQPNTASFTVVDWANVGGVPARVANSAGVNLVYDGGFTLGGAGWTSSPAGWSASANPTWGVLADSTTSNTAYSSPAFAVTGGATYTLGLDFGGVGWVTSSSYAQIQWFSDAAGTVSLGYSGAATGAPSAGWNRGTMTGAAPANAISARVKITCGALSGTGANLSVRRVKVEGGAVATDFTDDATSGASSVPWTGVTGSSKPQDNATKSTVWYQNTAPASGMTVNDIWVNPNTSQVCTWSGSAWVIGANNYTLTSQLQDDQGLGATASIVGGQITDIHGNKTYVDNTRLIGPNANRVRFSQFEAGQAGWIVRDQPGWITEGGPSTYNGLTYINATGTATAAGQVYSLGTAFTGYNIPVTPGERLAVSAQLGIGNGYLSSGCVWFYNASGGAVGSALTFAATPSNADLPAWSLVGGFVTVPTSAVYGQVEFYTTTRAAGATSLSITQVMVSTATVDQQILPPFTPGPSAYPGATVGANWSASGGSTVGNVSGIPGNLAGLGGSEPILNTLLKFHPTNGTLLYDNVNPVTNGASAIVVDNSKIGFGPTGKLKFDGSGTNTQLALGIISDSARVLQPGKNLIVNPSGAQGLYYWSEGGTFGQWSVAVHPTWSYWFTRTLTGQASPTGYQYFQTGVYGCYPNEPIAIQMNAFVAGVIPATSGDTRGAYFNISWYSDQACTNEIGASEWSATGCPAGTNVSPATLNQNAGSQLLQASVTAPATANFYKIGCGLPPGTTYQSYAQIGIYGVKAEQNTAVSPFTDEATQAINWGAKLGLNAHDSTGTLLADTDVKNTYLSCTTDTGGPGGRVRIALTNNGNNLGSLTPLPDGVQNQGIGVSGGLLTGTGASGVYVDNSVFALDSSGHLTYNSGGTRIGNTSPIANNRMALLADGRFSYDGTNPATVNGTVSPYVSNSLVGIATDGSGQFKYDGSGSNVHKLTYLADAATVLTPQINLLYNPTFALGLDGWQPGAPWGGGGCSIGYGKDSASGSYANLTGAANGGSACTYGMSSTRRNFAVYPGQSITLAADYDSGNSPAGSSAYFQISWLDPGNNNAHVSDTAGIGGNTAGAWKRTSITLTAPSGNAPSGASYYTCSADLCMYLPPGTGTYSVYFRNVMLNLGTTASPYRDDSTTGAIRSSDGATLDTLSGYINSSGHSLRPSDGVDYGTITQYHGSTGQISSAAGMPFNMQLALGYIFSPASPFSAVTSSSNQATITIPQQTLLTMAGGYSILLPTGSSGSTLYGNTTYTIVYDQTAKLYSFAASGNTSYVADGTNRYLVLGTLTTPVAPSSGTSTPVTGGGGGSGGRGVLP